MSDLLLKMPLQYEPLKKNRWILRFPADLGIQEWWLSSASVPSINIEDKKIPFLNTQTHVAGNYTWSDITLKFRSPIGPSASQALMEWIRLVAESVTGRMGYAIGYKRNLELELLDPNGVTVSKWIIVNAYPTSFEGGDLTYSSDDLIEHTMKIAYDYAILAY